MTVKARKYWSCPKCGYRNEGRTIKCRGTLWEGIMGVACDARRPKRRVPKHARTLRDDSYADYAAMNAIIHGLAHDIETWDPHCCGVCGKPPSTSRHMDRDHDHVTGNPRGLACPGNSGCNALMPRQMTLERARLIVAYLERVEAHYRVAT